MSLQSTVKVLVTEKGIRRAVLLDKATGMPLELQSVFIWHKRPTKSLNSHKANLRDLAHFEEWCLYQKENNKKWASPLDRLLQKQLPLKKGELDNYFSWAQQKASVLSNERRVSGNKRASIRRSRVDDVVDARTTDRRLRTISQYLCWLTDLILNDFINLGRKELIETKQSYKTEIRDHLHSKISNKNVGPTIRSLNEKDAATLRKGLNDETVYTDTVCGNRDRLIVEFELETGLRPGELLSLQTNDITYSTVLLPSGKQKEVGVLSVVKRPNNPRDSRIDSPAAKTKSGLVPFSYSLYLKLTEYIMGPRREAVDFRGGVETEFLFVNHAGKSKGLPLQQRNLNRIFETLKKSPDLPESMSPYTMRHTHFTEFSDEVVASGGDLRGELSARGRWSKNSSSMDGYILRYTSNKSSQRIAERDEELEPDQKHLE